MTDRRAEKAHAAVAQYAAFEQNVRANARLSDAEKTSQLARGWVATADAVKTLVDDALSERERKRDALMRKVVRPPAPVLVADQIAMKASYRDALLRADKATKDELADLLRISEMAGDELQVQAVIATAVKRGDVDTANLYIESHPEAEPDLQELFNLGGENGLKAELQIHFAMPTPPKPGELAGLTEYEIREIAGQPVDSAEVAMR